MAKEHLKYESTEIDRRLDLAGTALQEHQDISHLATKEEVAKGLDAKENVIEDLAEIRRGAGLGATALQEHQDISHLATKTKVVEDLAKKVDKVSGKQLSTEDYTTAEKTKLRGLYNYDDTTVKASIKSVEDKVNTKQDIVQDLETIRQGASKGATAIQEVKTINGKSVVGSGDILLVTEEEFNQLKDEIIANELVVAEALNDINERIKNFANEDYVAIAVSKVITTALNEEV